MTALCGGGTSSTKLGVAALITYGSGLIADVLVSLESPWLIPVIPLLGLPPLATNTFCASDPPAQPTFTSAEATALLELRVGSADWNSGVTKVQSAIENALWNQLCECNNGTGVPQPTPIPLPTGVPQLQLPTGGNIQPCSQVIFNTTANQGTGQSFNRGGTQSLIGLGATTANCHAVNSIFSGTGIGIDFIWEQIGTGPPTTKVTRHVAAGTTDDVSIPIQPGCTSVIVTTTSTTGTGTSVITGSSIQIFCGGQGLPIGTTACPPDPVVHALLQSILDMVTLIQRQHVPFAYISGTVHGPLHGTGQFALNDVILGLLVTVTGIDSTIGQETGTPTRLFNVGFVSVGDADGFWCGRQITSASELFFPASAGAATLVGWTTSAGASLTITELKREA